MTAFLQALWTLSLDLAPWLLMGLLVAGLLKALIPTALVARYMGGEGIFSIVASAVLGAPLPLCSCSVLPVAVTLRRQGASRGATASFLISTPETGVDSVAVSYALLGPFLTVARPIAAVVSAVAVGLAVTLTPYRKPADAAGAEDESLSKACCESEQAQAVAGGGSACGGDNCCGGEVAAAAGASGAAASGATASGAAVAKHEHDDAGHDCCGAEVAAVNGGQNHDHDHNHAEGEHCDHEPAAKPKQPMGAKLVDGLKYSVTTLLDDLVKWLVLGLVMAAIVAAFVSPGALASWGQGPLAMIVMVLIGIPMYICATSSTPLAGALLLAGVSPGTVLVFLLAGPATNIATIGVLRRELGGAATWVYFAVLAVMSIAAGLVTDAIVGYFNVSVVDEVSQSHGLVPHWLAITCLVLLVLLAIKPLRNRAFAWMSSKPGSGKTGQPQTA